MCYVRFLFLCIIKHFCFSTFNWRGEVRAWLKEHETFQLLLWNVYYIPALVFRNDNWQKEALLLFLTLLITIESWDILSNKANSGKSSLRSFYNLPCEEKWPRTMSEVNSATLMFAVILLTLPAAVFLQRARKFNIYFPHQSENSSLSSFIH